MTLNRQEVKFKTPLFDINLTLLEGGDKAHIDSYDYAIRRVYGINASVKEMTLHGMIDPQIIVESLIPHGLREEDIKAKLEEAFKVMEEYFLEHEGEDEDIVMPGAKELLERLKDLRVPLGILSGIIESVAWKKLEKVGLKEYFIFGAFGNRAFKRVDLVKVAQEQAEEKLGRKVPLADLVIIGDSPLDVACAKAGGIQSIAVGAGPYSSEELRAAGADLVVDSLKEQESIINFLSSHGA